MRKTYLTLLLLLIFPFFVGCASISNPGFPKQSYDEEKEFEDLQDTFKTSEMIKKYFEAAPESRTKAMRDGIITARLLLTNKLYNRFVAQSAAEKQGFDTFTDIAVIGVDLAVATVGGESTKSALGAISAGITGSKLSIDKNYYFEKTISVLITAMNAQRKVVLLPIKRGMRLTIEEYSLAEALSDLDSYYFAGTFIGALESIAEDAGAKGKEASDNLEFIRTKSFVDKISVDRVVRISGKIKALTPDKALEIIKDPPGLDAKTQKLVDLRDPNKLRLTDSNAAKAILKMIATMGDRSDASLDKWEKVLGIN